MIKKGIILAGGTGTRMSPLTKAVNKQLLPIYDKPLFFYPLSVLMLSGIRDILIIVNKGQLNQFKKVLPNGNNLGIKITYIEQKYPKGLPDAFQVGEKFIGKDNVVSYSKKLKPSKRNEVEIVDLLKKYKSSNKLSAEFLGRGAAWLDTGSIKDFYNTSAFVSALENRQGLKIACLEEIAFNNKWIKKNNILEAIKFYGNCEYSKYLSSFVRKH